MGSGCAKCEELYDNAQKAAQEANVDCEMVKVTDMNEIMSFGVMITPALAIDGKVMFSGRVASSDEIKKFFD